MQKSTLFRVLVLKATHLGTVAPCQQKHVAPEGAVCKNASVHHKVRILFGNDNSTYWVFQIGLGELHEIATCLHTCKLKKYCVPAV